MKFPFMQSHPTIQVAIDLLGAVLCRRDESGHLLKGRIVETEAYLGLTDPACHSFHAQRTRRVEALYRPAGHSYIYMIYGMYYCFNVVTQDESTPEAVLVRAVEPLSGIEIMKARRKKSSLKDLCTGPGKLAQAFDLGPELNGHPLGQPPLWIEKAPTRPKETLLVSARIGLSKKEASSFWPLRFYLEGAMVSPAKPAAASYHEATQLEAKLTQVLSGRPWRLASLSRQMGNRA